MHPVRRDPPVRSAGSTRSVIQVSGSGRRTPSRACRIPSQAPQLPPAPSPRCGQPSLEGRTAVVFEFRVVHRGVNAVFAKPARHAIAIGGRQTVDDARPWQLRDVLGEPRRRSADRRARSSAATATPRVSGPRWISSVSPSCARMSSADALVGSGCGGEHGHIPRQRAHDANDATVVRSEIVPPVRDAMGFVHYQQPDAAWNAGERHGLKSFVGEAFWRHEQHVDFVTR